MLAVDLYVTVLQDGWYRALEKREVVATSYY